MRVRRALGLDRATPRSTQTQGDPSRHRHRFVQDGEVPVVVVRGERRQEAHPSGSRVAELVATLEAERAAGAALARLLEETRATIQSLQTRLTHAELAHGEAIAVERQSRAETEAALARERRVAAELTLRRSAEPVDKSIGGTVAAAKALAPRKPHKAKASPKDKRSAVVKWWSPAFKATRSPR